MIESLCRLTIEGLEENLEIKFTYDSAYPYIHSMKWWIFVALNLFITPAFGQDERLEEKLEEAMRLSEQETGGRRHPAADRPGPRSPRRTPPRVRQCAP